jgi:O-antigen/teichoic acid export membrane protein
LPNIDDPSAPEAPLITPDGEETLAVTAAATAPTGSQKLRAKVMRGSMWTLVGYGASQALRLLNNLILWRLLYPEAFGLMAIVSVCLIGLAMFSDIGIGPSIVQHERGDEPDYLNTAWTIQVGREIILCGVACLLAVPIAAFYHEPQLAHLLPAAALASLLAGFNSTRLFTATRTLSLGRVTLIDLGAQAASLVVMIGWAWVTRSIWALIAGSVVYNGLRLLGSHTMLPGVRNRFHWDRTCARAMMRFGRWIFFSTLMTFIVMQSDRLIFGKMIPMALLGVYSIATTWAGLPYAVISRVFNAVLFPLLSRIHNEGAALSRVLRNTRRPWLILAGCATACLISGGPLLIHLLYGAKAEKAGWIIQVLASSVWLLSLESANGIALLALGQSKWIAVGNAAKLVGMVALIPVGYHFFGFPGAVVALASSELLHYGASAIGVRRRRISCLGQDAGFTAVVLATTVLGLAVARWVAPAVHGLGLRPAKLAAVLELGIISVVASAAWAYAYWMHRHHWSRVEEPVAVAQVSQA